MKKISRFLCLSLSVIGLLIPSLSAELGFIRYFDDGMVLQQEKPLKVKGYADADADVVLSFAGQSKKATADRDGRWEISLNPVKASSKGQKMTLQSKGKEVSLSDILVGDVILVARQTTINLTLEKQPSGQDKASEAKAGSFRVMNIKAIPAGTPQTDLRAEATQGWAPISEANALKMDAVAFHLGAGLAHKHDVPVGIVDLNMGYHFPLAWMSRDDLMETGKVFGEDKTVVEGQVEAFTLRLHKNESGEVKKDIEEHHAKAVAKAKERKQPLPSEPLMPPHPLTDPRYPAAGYNAVIHPLKGMAFSAVLLQVGNDYPYVIYQDMDRKGESLKRGRLGMAWKETYDLKKWCIYMEPFTLPRVVTQWRHYFSDLNLPFGLITPPSSDLGTLAQHHVEIRELQRRVAEDNKGVSLIIPDMAHIPFSAQAKDQEVIGKRSLAWYQGAVLRQYGAIPTGPLFERVLPNYSEATVHFQPGTAEGLKAAPGALEGFEVAGTDAEYTPAKAELSGITVKLSSETVNRIVHVRYNWKQNPNLGLTNTSGLPAVPFRTDRHKFPRTIKHTESGLPSEYTTPAKDWTSGDVAIINGSLARGNWKDGEGWLGVTGIMVAPFGPNMGVLQVVEGSPAEGKIFEGDVIYDVNGTLLGESPLKDVAAALTHAESETGAGKISFGVRRSGENLNVELKIEVLGTYSSTSPYDCPKTDRIVSNMEKFLAKRGGTMQSHTVFSNSDALFMLAAGTPEYQGLVRRKVYRQMGSYDTKSRIDPLQKRHPQNWHFAYNALLTAEYFMATGDRNVLDFLKWNLDYLAVTQNKVEASDTPWPRALAGSAGGWRHNFYGGLGYGMLPTIGVPAILSFRYAMDIGLEVDESAYQRGLDYFKHNGVEVGTIIYGNFTKAITEPPALDLDAAYKGKLPASNGMRGMAAILYSMIKGEERTAHICSFYAANSFNNIAHAHGGNFWGNWMTGAGAYVHSKEAFIRFMKGHAWYRDLHRMFDHSHYQGNAGIGGGQYLSMVLPRHRLRLLSASESVFMDNPKEIFRPALDAHRDRNYPLAETLAQGVLDGHVLSPVDKAKAQQLVDLAKELQVSIAHDLNKVEALIKAKKYYEAKLDLPQLQGVVPKGDARLAAIEKVLNNPELEATLKIEEKEYNTFLKSLDINVASPKPASEDEAKWTCLTPQSNLARRIRSNIGKVPEEEANQWSFKVVESMAQAPEGWTQPNFDDSSWLKTALPMSWYLNHQALLRTTFDVEDKSSIDALRVRSWTYRQQNVQIFINGILVAKINQASNNATLDSLLSDGALKAIKNGKNTLAVTTLNNWRWGRYMTKFETDTANSVYNNGYTFLLDMRKK